MENWLYFENDERYGQVTNWKSHTPFLMKRKLSTLDNLEGHWQQLRSAIVATAGLLVIFDIKLVSRQLDH